MAQQPQCWAKGTCRLPNLTPLVPCAQSFRSQSQFSAWSTKATIMFLPKAISSLHLRLNSSTRLRISSADDPSISTHVEAAKEKLLWEKLQEQAQAPVLNLSTRDMSPEDISSDNEDASSSWDDGQLWEVTRTQLEEKGLFCSPGTITFEELLQSIPQLLRLDPDKVMETTQVLLEELGISPETLSKTVPELLAFPADDVRYGVRFLSTMMMQPTEVVIQTCKISPELLKAGVEGGLQEQSVSKALGAAADATDSATKRVAGDMASTMNQLRNKNNGGLL